MIDTTQPIVTLPVDKQKIIDIFRANVLGRTADSALANVKHAGRDGHWLETAMSIAHNASNSPDILGYEMKNGTSHKTTFGDWSADYYIFKDAKYRIDRDAFLRIFGKPNLKKYGRFSWSGEPCPVIGSWNAFGQTLIVDGDDNILAIYSYSKDLRFDKSNVVPLFLQQENLTLARWSTEMMRKRLESKFNDKGWFKCEKNANGVYISIAFGDPITFQSWLGSVKAGLVFFDSGMYQGNKRNYSQWRANNSFWDNLVTSRYS